MEFINQIIDYIARTNLFNFVIFAGIIIYLVKKLDVKLKIENARIAVDETIKESEKVKTSSEEQLGAVEESMLHIEEEIESIINASEENAKLVGKKILEDAEKNALTIQENTSKTLENNRLLLKNDLIRRASLASVEIAKAHIIEELNNNSGLHEKLINDSIESLEGVGKE